MDKTLLQCTVLYCTILNCIVQYSAPFNSYTLEMGKMSRNDFEASELIPMPCPKPNHEQKPNWRY